jgi:hypothetical protein
MYVLGKREPTRHVPKLAESAREKLKGMIGETNLAKDHAKLTSEQIASEEGLRDEMGRRVESAEEKKRSHARGRQ